MPRRVGASIPTCSGAVSSSGLVGICPVTKSQPSVAVAWLNGATGCGAPGIIRNSITAARSKRHDEQSVDPRRIEHDGALAKLHVAPVLDDLIDVAATARGDDHAVRRGAPEVEITL